MVYGVSSFRNNFGFQFECCGVNGTAYWGTDLLDSCYEGASKGNTLYTVGCAAAFRDIIMDNIKIIGGVAIGFAVVEVSGCGFGVEITIAKIFSSLVQFLLAW